MPRTGPCAPWVPGEDIKQSAAVAASVAKLQQQAPPAPVLEQLDEICATAAAIASEVLYEMSARVFTGECGPVTVRPVARPTDIDTRSWGARLSPLGWFSSWGLCSSYGSSTPGVVAHYGCSNPPEIELGSYPVTEIVLVKIDGVVIPSDEYELRDFRWLVRMRTSAAAAPTQRYGWPTCQINDLPDTEQGTFSVTYRYGQPPPLSGRLAALKLGEILALLQLGDTTKLPQRVTSISRQGVSAMTVDVMDIVKTGKTGIYEVDLFLRSVNPSQLSRPAAVWSPDIGRPRRQAAPSS